MSVANEFEATAIKFSESEKKAYILSSERIHLVFTFTFMCKVPGLCVMFNTDDKKMMVVTPAGLSNSPMSSWLCVVMKFWIESDLPVPAVRYWQDTNQLVSKIEEQFRDKHASYMLDSIINSD